LATVDRIFITVDQDTDGIMNNQAKTFMRYEFLEALVRIANAKFREGGDTESYSVAFKMLIDECIMVHYPWHPWQEFRDFNLWNLEVNDVFHAN